METCTLTYGDVHPDFGDVYADVWGTCMRTCVDVHEDLWRCACGCVGTCGDVYQDVWGCACRRVMTWNGMCGYVFADV